jgi:hypothetical protein
MESGNFDQCVPQALRWLRSSGEARKIFFSPGSMLLSSQQSKEALAIVQQYLWRGRSGQDVF